MKSGCRRAADRRKGSMVLGGGGGAHDSAVGLELFRLEPQATGPGLTLSNMSEERGAIRVSEESDLASLFPARIAPGHHLNGAAAGLGSSLCGGLSGRS